MILGTERTPSRVVQGHAWVHVTTLVRCDRCDAHMAATVTVGSSDDYRLRALADAYQLAARAGWTILADAILCPACGGAT